MQFGHLTEMETVDCKCDRQREQAWTPEQGPEKEPPVLDAFDAASPVGRLTAIGPEYIAVQTRYGLVERGESIVINHF